MWGMSWLNISKQLLNKINDINENFLQETTKLRLLWSSTAQYSKDNKQDIKDHSSKLKDLDYLTTEHTHKIYDINDLARKNLNEKLDIEKFKEVQAETEAKIEYNKKSIKDVDSNLKETDNYVEKYLPFRLSNLINEILKPITDEKGPLAGLIPNETQLKNKILFNILNDDGEPTLDKDGKEIKKLNKAIVRNDSQTISSPDKRSEISLSKGRSFMSYQDSQLNISPKKAEENSSSESDIMGEKTVLRHKETEYFNKSTISQNKQNFSYSESASGKEKSPIKSSQFKISVENFQETDDDQRFFSQSEKLLKVSV